MPINEIVVSRPFVSPRKGFPKARMSSVEKVEKVETDSTNTSTNIDTDNAPGNISEMENSLTTVEIAFELFREKEKELYHNGSLPFGPKVQTEIMNGCTLSTAEIESMTRKGEEDLFPIMKLADQSIIHFLGETISDQHVFGKRILSLSKGLTKTSGKPPWLIGA